MLDMVETTAKRVLVQLSQVSDLMSETSELIKQTLPKVYSKELIEILFRLPYTKRQFLIDSGLGTPKTVGNYLAALEEAGFLNSIRVGKEKLYLNKGLMNILEGK